MRRKGYQITLNPDVMERFQEFCKKLDLPVSRYLEMLMKSTMAAADPMQGMFKGMMTDIVECDRGLTRLQKEEALKIINEDEFKFNSEAASKASHSLASAAPSPKAARKKGNGKT